MALIENLVKGNDEQAYADFVKTVTEIVVGHTMKLDVWGQTYELKMSVSTYRNNGNLAIQLFNKNTDYDEPFWEPFATLTTNTERKLDDECLAIIDTNNCPWAEELIEKYQLGEDTELFEVSGFCVYPIYRMNKSAFEWFGMNGEG